MQIAGDNWTASSTSSNFEPAFCEPFTGPFPASRLAIYLVALHAADGIDKNNPKRRKIISGHFSVSVPRNQTKALLDSNKT